MTERPILFSGAMVRAILAGAKTQTRRWLKVNEHPGVMRWQLDSEYRAVAIAKSEQVVEQHRSTFPHGRVPCRYGVPGDRLWVRETFCVGYQLEPGLEITDVRVQRLQEISEEDARAEGCGAGHNFGDGTARTGFAMLWDSLNAERAPWSSNPWVWALSFRKL